MLLEVVDALRCTAAHEDAPLVASISRRADRDIVTGLLGCPICFAEYPIENSVAIFGDGPVAAADPPPDPYREPADELAMRCAAMLNLYDPGGIVLLGGAWADAAADLLEMARALVIVVAARETVRLGNGIAAVRTGAMLPFAPGSVRGIALDARTSTPSLVLSAVRALKPGGRLIAPVAAALPPGVTERARDDRHWVGEVGSAVSAPVQLGRIRQRGAQD
jgi:hypothetical protein